MQKKILKLNQRQVDMIAENEIQRLKMGETSEPETTDKPDSQPEKKSTDLDKMMGSEQDRRIEYPSPADVAALGMETKPDGEGGGDGDFDPKTMKSPPQELLEYLDKIEEAKSMLSKVAAKETDENIKNRIYSHYEKAQKLAFELIKEFGIVH